MPSIRAAHPNDRDRLLAIWLDSVRATHSFLTEADIQSLLPIVRDAALEHLELWVLCDDDQRAIGFMGLHGSCLEALFIHPAHIRRGGGSLLLEYARQLKGPLMVDVNEQNPDAIKFYLAAGFTVVGRSPLDSGGRPFPLLHLREMNPKLARRLTR
jgi:putative acetyltransferase